MPKVDQFGYQTSEKARAGVTGREIDAAANTLELGAGVQICSGTGAPTASKPKGSLYLRTDGSGVADRLYVATDAAGTWTNVTTAA